jgi:hypothetical protein
MTIDGTPAPAPSGEDKQWADLAAEVEIDAGDEPAGGEGGGDKQAGVSPGESDAAAETAKQAPIPYEELERRHRDQANALKETREREQAARDQLKAFAQMVEDMRAQRKAAPAQEAKQPDPVPDPNEDPVAYFEHKIAALQAEVAEAKKSTTETRAEAQSRLEYQSFVSEVSKHEDAFKAETPDYHQAAEYLEKGRRAELQILFPDTPVMDQQARANGYKNAAALREAVFVNDAQTVARNALMAGMNPAQAYYELAKGRGYRPGGGAGGGGEASADKTARANATIEAMRRGTKASKTISGGGGGPDNPLNVSDLTDLYAEDPEEFDRQWDKMAKAGKLG